MALIDEVRELRDEVRALNRMAETYKAEIQKHEEQLNGSRGISVALKELTDVVAGVRKQVDRLVALPDEVSGLRKSAYWLAGLIITGAIGFAFSVLALIP